MKPLDVLPECYSTLQRRCVSGRHFPMLSDNSRRIIAAA
jgi:hypothetical protein